MPSRFHLVASATLAMLLSAAVPVDAQVQLGTPVDRNVGDTGPNAASQRLAQPGIGQFGVGSLLLDRTGNNDLYQTHRFDPFVGDPRVSQRYLLQSPGVTVLIDRPDYIGPSPHGGWVFNEQTLDGAEVLTLTPANTVYVLSPELLKPSDPAQDGRAYEQDHPNRFQPRTLGDPYALMHNNRVTGQRAYTPAPTQPQTREETYRHPAILERERKLREERQLEAIKKAQAEAAADRVEDESDAEAKDESVDEREQAQSPQTVSDEATSSGD